MFEYKRTYRKRILPIPHLPLLKTILGKFPMKGYDFGPGISENSFNSFLGSDAACVCSGRICNEEFTLAQDCLAHIFLSIATNCLRRRLSQVKRVMFKLQCYKKIL